jgi:RNA polymerase sigma-70 factor (ECF subfamily)
VRSDAELVDAIRRGEAAAFEILVRRYVPVVRAEAMGILRDPHAAQDAVQDAFVAAHEKLATLRNGSAFGAWILKIARRQAVRLARQRRQTAPIDSASTATPDDRNGQLDQESQRLLEAVTQLPQQERMVVMFKYFEGHSVRTISDMTGQPVSTVTKQLSRARARLRERLKDMEP